MPRTVVIANGELRDPEAAAALVRPTDRLIAADGGAHHCRALGIRPHVLIGDMDSISADEGAALEAAGTRLVRHPARKDQTDLELAMEWAAREGATEILVLGALGARWDQTLANVLLLALPWLSDIAVQLVDGRQTIRLLRGPAAATLSGRPGDTVSLIPVGGEARGVATTGLEYPLSGGVLPFGSTLGISNALTAPEATVSLAEGLLICVVIGG